MRLCPLCSYENLVRVVNCSVSACLHLKREYYFYDLFFPQYAYLWGAWGFRYCLYLFTFVMISRCVLCCGSIWIYVCVCMRLSCLVHWILDSELGLWIDDLFVVLQKESIFPCHTVWGIWNGIIEEVL